MNTINRNNMNETVNAVAVGRSGHDASVYDGSTDEQSDSQKTMCCLLEESLGYYVVTQHLIGSSTLVNREGVLVRVLGNAFVLREDATDSYICCDYYALKFFRRLPYQARPGYNNADSCIPLRQRRSGQR